MKRHRTILKDLMPKSGEYPVILRKGELSLKPYFLTLLL